MRRKNRSFFSNFFVVWGADNETTLSLLDLISTCASTPLSPLPLARRRANEVAVPAPRRAAYLCVEAQIDAVGPFVVSSVACGGAVARPSWVSSFASVTYSLV